MSSDKYIHSDIEDKIYSYWEKHVFPNKNKSYLQYQNVYIYRYSSMFKVYNLII